MQYLLSIIIIISILYLGGLPNITIYADMNSNEILQEVPIDKDRYIAPEVHNFLYQIRCPVCNAESVSESNTRIAEKIRSLTQSYFEQGMDFKEIESELYDIYGERILLTRGNGINYLFVIPIIFLLCVFIFTIRKILF